MKKYSEKLINDYILGADIEDYSLEELENDKEFMILVIGSSNDYKLYRMCSESLKKDYDFVKFLIKKFKDNIEFICEVADNYLLNAEDEISTLELNIIMKDYTAKDQKKNLIYKLACEMSYMAKMVNIECSRKELNDTSSLDIGKGFILIFDTYSSSEIILNYFATRLIQDIFYDDNLNFEKLLIQQFDSPEQIDEIGINTIVLDFIAKYDKCLFDYLSIHLELLSGIKKDIKKTQNKWQKHIERHEREKYELMLELVNDYLESVKYNTVISSASWIYFVGKRLGIVDKIMKYSDIPEKEYQMLTEDMNGKFIEDNCNNILQERINYNRVMEIMKNTIFPNTIPPRREDNFLCEVTPVNYSSRK